MRIPLPTRRHAIMYGAAFAAGGIILALRPSTFDFMNYAPHPPSEDKYFLSDNGVKESNIDELLDGNDDLRAYYHITDISAHAEVYGLKAVVNTDTRLCFKAAVIKTATDYVIHPKQYCTTQWDVLGNPQLRPK